MELQHPHAPEAGVAPLEGAGASTEPRLAELRDRLATVEDVPLAQRPALFEQVNATLVESLRALDEG